MKTVILENCVLRPGDLDWTEVRRLTGPVLEYPRTAPEEIAARIGDAELVILNKCRIGEETLRRCPRLQWIGITATGADNIDLEACRRRGVLVANVPGYSTYSVAQHTFSLLLAACQCAERYNRAVQAGYWQMGVPAEFGLLPQTELYGKTLGIFGCGAIGSQVARIGRAFGMRVLACTRTPRPGDGGVEFTDLDTLLAGSDVLSLHAPATPATRGVIGADALARIKPGCILLNTARGALVDEAAVAAACRSGRLGFYAADAMAVEPLPADSPLRGLPNVLLTPHIAWTTAESLARLTRAVAQNLRSYLQGCPENVVNR